MVRDIDVAQSDNLMGVGCARAMNVVKIYIE